MALIANANRGKRARPFDAADFFPFDSKGAGADVPKGDIKVLKAVFVDGQKRRRKGGSRGP